ncbi:MAG: TrmO family methyltransferase, partial [Candidatus Thermoplasmatota archaeon]|nr:TrmO family methyltransferase [Candidatus Thermoplasmatota archaeon]
MRIEDLGLIFFINLFPPFPLSFIPLFSPIFPIHLLIIKNDIFTNKLYFTGVDMLDETPLLDIKPFVRYFDNRENTD